MVSILPGTRVTSWSPAAVISGEIPRPWAAPAAHKMFSRLNRPESFDPKSTLWPKNPSLARMPSNPAMNIMGRHLAAFARPHPDDGRPVVPGKLVCQPLSPFVINMNHRACPVFFGSGKQDICK